MTAHGGATSVVDHDAPAPRARARAPDVRGGYEAYISSGLYDRRYPRPNERTLRKSLGFLRKGGRFLDFGAGTGRYTLPLMERTRASGVAYDVCPAACRAMADRLRGFVDEGRLVIRDGEPGALTETHRRSFDLALMAFGVLGHVAGRAARLRLLGAIREMLKPEGVLVLGLPNARRRFRAARRAAVPLVRAGELEAGDILYTRGRDADGIRLFYHLFSPSEARDDLSAAGFRIESIEPESLLPEYAVVGSPLLGRLDDLACRVAPAASGYGFLIVARPLASDVP